MRFIKSKFDGLTSELSGHTNDSVKHITSTERTSWNGKVDSVTVSGSGNAVTTGSINSGKLTLTKGSTFLTEHPTISTSTDSTGTSKPTFGGTFKAIETVTRDGNGHVTKVNTQTVTIPNATATASTPGLMSSTDKSYVDAFYDILITSGISIPSGDNLNNYLEPGKYRAGSDEVSKTIENCPYTNAGFSMFVVQINTYMHQFLFPNTSRHHIYHRRYEANDNKVWSDWGMFTALDATQNSSGYMSAEDKTTFDKIPSTYALKGHTHNASDIGSGVLPVERGGTGETGLNQAANSFIKALAASTTVPKDDTNFITQAPTGENYYRRPMSTVWDWLCTEHIYQNITSEEDSWGTIGISPNKSETALKVLRGGTGTGAVTPPSWFAAKYGAGIAFGGSDSKGVVSLAHSTPKITFAAGSNSSTSAGKPSWYISLIGTSEVTYDLAVLEDIIDSGHKNLVNVSYCTVSKNGVNAVCRQDGSITLTGKNTSSGAFVLISNINYGKTSTGSSEEIYGNCLDGLGTYTVDLGVNTSDVRLQVFCSDDGTSSTNLGSADGTYTFNYSKERNFTWFRLYVAANADFSKIPLTVRPMICKTSSYNISSKFVSYGMSNSQLTTELNSYKKGTFTLTSDFKNATGFTSITQMGSTVTLHIELSFTKTNSGSGGQTLGTISNVSMPFDNGYSWTAPVLFKTNDGGVVNSYATINPFNGIVSISYPNGNYTISGCLIDTSWHGANPALSTELIASGLMSVSKVSESNLTNSPDISSDISESTTSLKDVNGKSNSDSDYAWNIPITQDNINELKDSSSVIVNTHDTDSDII